MRVKFEKLCFKVGKQHILENICVDFLAGNLYCVLGKNGAGKSSMFNLVMELIAPTNGEILYDGNHYKRIPVSLKRKMAFLGEETNVLDELSAFQYLDFVATLYNVKSGIAKIRILELLQYFFDDINSLKRKRIGSYSTGMRKKISLCACLIHDPDFIILDEPFAGLDPETSMHIIELIQTLRTKQRTVLIADHNLGYMKNIDPDEVILLEEGKIIFNKKREELDLTINGLDELLLAELLNKQTQSHKKSLSWL